MPDKSQAEKDREAAKKNEDAAKARESAAEAKADKEDKEDNPAPAGPDLPQDDIEGAHHGVVEGAVDLSQYPDEVETVAESLKDAEDAQP